MQVIAKEQLEWVQNHSDEIPMDNEETVFAIPNEKWVDRRFCEYNQDGKKYYVVIYAIFDNHNDGILHYEDAYMSENFEEMKSYYISLFSDLDGIKEIE